jgi:hypothetical protein
MLKKYNEALRFQWLKEQRLDWAKWNAKMWDTEPQPKD